MRLKECQATCRYHKRQFKHTLASSSGGLLLPHAMPTESQLQQSDEWKQKGNVAFRAKSVPEPAYALKPSGADSIC